MTTFFEIILIISNITAFVLMTFCILVFYRCIIPKSANDFASHSNIYAGYYDYEKLIISSTLITTAINSLLSIINVIMHLSAALVTLCMCMLAYTVIFAILYTCLKLYKSYTDKICRVFSFVKLNTKKYDSKVVLALFSNKDTRSTLIKTFIEPLNNLLITAKSFNTKEKKMKFYEEVVEVKIDEFVNAMQDEYNKLKLQDESVIDAFKKRI